MSKLNIICPKNNNIWNAVIYELQDKGYTSDENFCRRRPRENFIVVKDGKFSKCAGVVTNAQDTRVDLTNEPWVQFTQALDNFRWKFRVGDVIKVSLQNGKVICYVKEKKGLYYDLICMYESGEITQNARNKDYVEANGKYIEVDPVIKEHLKNQ